MKKLCPISLLTLLVTAWLALPLQASHNHDDLSLRQQETIRLAYTLRGTGPDSLEIDNVWGAIHVVGADAPEVKVVIQKSIRANSDANFESAKREVTLDADRQPNSVRLYVEGPFRCQHSKCDCCDGGNTSDRYIVQFDFEVQVPRTTALNLRTVTNGDISVAGVEGDFSLHNVNGSIDMQDAAGSGKATTVNGRVTVTFRANPKSDSEFSTINGPIELYFASNLSADFRFKNFNGGIYSDYDLSALPNRQVQGEHRNGKFIYHADEFTSARAGSGGPEIKIETLNGDIRVLARSI